MSHTIRRSWWLAVLALVAMALVGVACTSAPATPSAQNQSQPAAKPADATPKTGGTLTIGQDFGPNSFDPHKNTAWASTNINESIYEGLLQWNDKETELIPDLATSWTVSPDGLTYTFKIRKGVKFHNGREMTA